MRLNWLGTTAVALLIGTGAVIAQSQDTPQKREEGPRAQTPKDADRPAAREQRSRDGMKDRTAQPEPKGTKEPQRGEAPSPAERKQAQEPARDTKQPAQQGQERGERTSPTQQTQERQQGRDAKQPDTKQQQGRQPADTRQQQGQTTLPSTTSQPATTSPTAPMRQDARPGERDRQQGQTTGQARDSTRTGTSSLQVDDQQRTQIVDRLRRERTATTQNINIDVRVGQRLPARVRPLPLPRDIVRIAPQYRGYSYIVVQEQIYIVSPRTREVVDIIYEPGSARTAVRSERVMITREQRDTLRQAARRMTTAPTSGSASAALDQSCLTLQPVPEELVRANPEFGSYRYLAIGEQVILLDPRQQRIVEVID